MLSNGEWLFAHCSTKLHYIIRQAPFAVAHLVDEQVSIDFNEVTTPKDRVAVIATIPLTTNETWQAMNAGEMVYFSDGQVTKVL
jgi:predicted glutamine amidotransferase